VMRELNIDISAQRSKPVSEFEGQQLDFVITVCNKTGGMPGFFPGTRTAPLAFKDPAAFTQIGEARLQAFRTLRGKIHARVMVFLGEGAYGSREEA